MKAKIQNMALLRTTVTILCSFILLSCAQPSEVRALSELIGTTWSTGCIGDKATSPSKYIIWTRTFSATKYSWKVRGFESVATECDEPHLVITEEGESSWDEGEAISSVDGAYEFDTEILTCGSQELRLHDAPPSGERFI